jgi:hypothetical protein
MWQLIDKLYALSPQPLDYFGGDIMLQGDRLIVTNGRYDSPLGIFIFARQANDHWLQQTVIPFENPSFIALDGNTLAVTTSEHLVQLFQFDGAQWVFGQEISAPVEVALNGDVFASSVALQGNVLIVGATADYPQTLDKTGMVIIYTKVNNQWQFSKILKGFSPDFGRSVSFDGSIGVIGGDEGVYALDMNDSSLSLKPIANQNDYAGSFIGQNVKLHNNVVAFTVSPGYSGSSLPAEHVVFYKKMEDNRWHLLDDLNSNFTPALTDDVVQITGFGWGLDFNDQDIFIGEPAGIDLPYRGKLHLLSTVNDIQQP